MKTSCGEGTELPKCSKQVVRVKNGALSGEARRRMCSW